MRPFPSLISLFAVIALAGCASVPPAVVKQYPPSDLVQDCRLTPYVLSTNADLAKAIISLRGDIQLCNNDKKALRLWMED